MTTAPFTPCPGCPTQDGCGFMGRCLDREAPQAVNSAALDELMAADADLIVNDVPANEPRKSRASNPPGRTCLKDGGECPTPGLCPDVLSGCLLRPAPASSGAPVPPRAAVLREAERIVSRDRNAEHGEPEDSFARTAALWAAYRGASFTAADVAAMLALLKLARLAHNPGHRDSWVDLAGYAACGAEVACNAPKMAQSGPLSGGVASGHPSAPKTQEARQ